MNEWIGAIERVSHGSKAEIIIIMLLLITIGLAVIVYKGTAMAMTLWVRPKFDVLLGILSLGPKLDEVVSTNKDMVRTNKEFTHKVNNLATQVQGFSDRLNNHEEDVWKEINTIKERVTTIEAKIGMR
jgi:hypothetical protein